MKTIRKNRAPPPAGRPPPRVPASAMKKCNERPLRYRGAVVAVAGAAERVFDFCYKHPTYAFIRDGACAAPSPARALRARVWPVLL
ncbi:hypothetical protein EVAR_64941_1 [Eumeta japonica]|uniref:Uncharacterized protein n=1 Tax=Eumeta variegata TaxID=151549 RepID=A0A4C1ZDN4_EUMVA|nr:hypothetical protein EVAR_64941_1 [Eumeta japonica]